MLHNNVGTVEVSGAVETSEESWDRVNDVNLKGMFLTCKHVLPHMERQGKGAIANIASVSGIRWLTTTCLEPRKIAFSSGSKVIIFRNWWGRPVMGVPRAIARLAQFVVSSELGRSTCARSSEQLSASANRSSCRAGSGRRHSPPAKKMRYFSAPSGLAQDFPL